MCAGNEIQQTSDGFESSFCSSFSATNHLEADIMVEDKRKHNGKNLLKYRGKLHSNWRGGITGNHKLQYQLRKKRHPEKVKIQKQLNNAVYRGLIIKPNICSRCGKITEKKNIEGHHKDYNKPFAVEWLCKQCHCNIHKGHKKSF